MSPHQLVESSNLKQFFIGVVICSLGAFLAYGMLESTSWTTYSDADQGTYQGEFGQNTYDYDVQQDIGLHYISLERYFEECDEDDRCYSEEMDKKHKILENPQSEDGELFECKNQENIEIIKLCEAESAGSMGYSIIQGGLGLLALSLFLAAIGVLGYIPGWILTLLNSISGITIFIAPIVWYVMLPDLNSGMEPSDPKFGLSYAFYLTLLSGPVIFVGGLFFASMEAFSLGRDEDWDEDDYENEDEEYSAISSSMSRPNRQKFERPNQLDVNWQGVWGDDGYEWIEHPEGSEIWYWRDQETGQWVRH